MKSLQSLNVAAKAVVELFLFANSSESSSILGIVLGNFGLNLNNFCNDFNSYTKDLPSYFLLKVRIVVFENRTFSYSCVLASIGYFLRLLSSEVEMEILHNRRLVRKSIQVINILDLLGLFRLKFVYLSLSECFPM